MATDLIEIDSERPAAEALDKAAAAIRRGSVIAIPTDALYSLVADPFSLHAVGKVFVAKGREPHRSLPLLVSDIMMAEELSKDLPARFFVLARHFWPGPLTMIVPASARVPLRVTGNTGRLALAPVALARWRTDCWNGSTNPLIATSANISGQPTCRSGIEVFGQMDGRVDLVLDGGPVYRPGQ